MSIPENTYLTPVNVYGTVYDMNNTLTRPTFLTPVARRLHSEALAEEDTYFETPGQRALEDATVALPYETMRDLVLR